MPGLIGDIDPAVVRANLDGVRARAGPGVRILVATKYVPVEAMGLLAEAGVELVGENRAQDLRAKQELHGERFEWHFIGALQSRKVQEIAPRVKLIHSVASDSVLRRLATAQPNRPEVLIQVNVAGEEQKAGILPAELGGFIARCPAPVIGLMTMPPVTHDPESSRPHFAKLAELASEHGLAELSMGTSQDWPVAISEGATIIRLGATVLKGQNGA
ncbi:MAG: YggS family pyridoxal phosphate enzyme [Actinomycetota bacterium]|nr:YggS family pyridoxal phosphate enzyme [Actinomycetota bacterium]